VPQQGDEVTHVRSNFVNGIRRFPIRVRWPAVDCPFGRSVEPQRLDRS
jgi:hypothetical protein